MGSYRWRRRLVWIGAALACTVGAVVAISLLPNSNGQPKNLNPTGTTPAQTVAQILKQVHLTKADREAVNRTLVPFVRLGVSRKDPGAVWSLATPAMQSAVSRKEWNSGNLPVLPFSARIASDPTWNVLTSYPGDVTIDVLLQPKRGSKHGPIAFAVELKRRTKTSPWLIDSMIPEQGFAPTPTASASKNAKAGGSTEAAAEPSNGHGNTWLYFIPGALLALIIVVPVAVLLNNWRKHRAIERRYRAERGA
jgi:hypothetical protein